MKWKSRTTVMSPEFGLLLLSRLLCNFSPEFWYYKLKIGVLQKQEQTQNTIEIKFIPSSSETKLLCDLWLRTKTKLNTRQKTIIIIIHIFALGCQTPFFPTMNFVKLISQMWFPPSGCKDIEIWKLYLDASYQNWWFW